MGKRGPAKTPTPVLQLRGSWRADTRDGEPQGPEGTPECPARLLDEARQIWDEIVPILDNMGVLTLADGNALTRYCSMFVRWWKAEEFLQKNGDSYPIYQTTKGGELVYDKNGRKILRYMQQWPQVSIAKSLNASLLRLEQEFGLTPAARAGLSIGGKRQESGDPFEQLMRSRGVVG